MLRLTIDPDKPDSSLLAHAAEDIRRGGIAVYPTETIYGLAVIYNDGHALERLFAAKGRRESNPVLLLIENAEQLDMLARDVSRQASILARRWWPGPLTLMFTARPGLSPHLTGQDGKVACRVSSHPVAQKIVQLVGSPITSTSANFSGCPGASRVEDISGGLLERVDVVVDAGATPGGLASTILDVSARPFTLVREGAIPPGKLFL